MGVEDEIGTEVYIGVGSNIEPRENISGALLLLKEYVSFRRISPFYLSAAVGASGGSDSPDSPDYINGAFHVTTDYTPRELKFAVLRVIEENLGRVRKADKYANRTIDLDILLFGSLVLDTENMTVPDHGVTRHPFVGVPLLDLAPDLIVPGSKARLKDLFPLSPERYGLRLLPEFTEKLSRLL